jgi:hypothetical protein
MEQRGVICCKWRSMRGPRDSFSRLLKAHGKYGCEACLRRCFVEEPAECVRR